jgi:DNA-binding MarR family transcriptional regulator
MRQNAESDLGISHILVLHELRNNGESRPSDLAAILGFTPASLTHLSTKLGNKKLITKRQDESDKRVSFWKITKDGEELLDRAQEEGQIVRKEIFSHLTEDEQQALLEIYIKLDNSLQEEGN